MMRINDFHIQLGTAIPPVEKIESRKGRTYRAEIQTDSGRHNAYLKLLNTEDIVREALCATLARVLALPVKQAFYVYADPQHLAGQLTSNVDHVAFGIEADILPAFRAVNYPLEELTRNWQDTLRCAVFDEWIFNKDRNPGNLIFVTSKEFWLIDHDEALPNYASAEGCCGSQLLLALSKGATEFQKRLLRQNALGIVEQITNVKWNEIYGFMLAGNLTGSEPYFKKHIEFLKERTCCLPRLISEVLGIKQMEIDLNNLTSARMKEKNE